MTQAPERIWLAREHRYAGSPWLNLTDEFDDDPDLAEYVRADIHDAATARLAAADALIETLVGALADAAQCRLSETWLPEATALHAQIAPTLRAEGMEMAATKIEAGIPMLRNCGMVDVAAMMQGTADEIRAEAARLREGGEG
jgi:hypothetical protein